MRGLGFDNSVGGACKYTTTIIWGMCAWSSGAVGVETLWGDMGVGKAHCGQ